MNERKYHPSRVVSPKYHPEGPSAPWGKQSSYCCLQFITGSWNGCPKPHSWPILQGAGSMLGCWAPPSSGPSGVERSGTLTPKPENHRPHQTPSLITGPARAPQGTHPPLHLQFWGDWGPLTSNWKMSLITCAPSVIQFPYPSFPGPLFLPLSPSQNLIPLMPILLFLFFYIMLLLFGCAGSSLLLKGFPYLQWAGVTL